MVRFPWSSKSKDKGGRTQKASKEREVKLYYLPRGRMWEEPGHLETYHEERQRMMAKASEAVEETPLGSKARRKMDWVEKKYTKPFHDPVNKKLVFDIFDRPWGTEVLVFVLWARWDDVGVHVVERGFVVEIDLGRTREVKTRPNESYRFGGKHFLRYRQRDMPNLPEPKLLLEKGILHILFEGVTISPGGHGIKMGHGVDRSGEELLAYLEEEDKRYAQLGIKSV